MLLSYQELKGKKTATEQEQDIWLAKPTYPRSGQDVQHTPDSRSLQNTSPGLLPTHPNF